MKVTTRAIFDIETMEREELVQEPGEYIGPVAECRGEMKQRMATQDVYAGQSAGRAGQTWGAVFPGYQAMLTGGGYSPAERSAIEQGTFGPLATSFEAAGERATNRLARTRNPAGYGEMLDELARARGRSTAEAGFGIQKGFADEAQRRKEAALRGLSGLYGIDQETLARLEGSLPQPQPGFWDTFGTTVAKNMGNLFFNPSMVRGGAQ